MNNKRLEKQINFIIEIDKLKQIYRQSYIIDKSRQENSAEHSWHISILALILREYAPSSIDVHRVIKMLLFHDIVEIDAGDTFLYDKEGNTDKSDREKMAAQRLFGLLPEDQAGEFRALWDEFEERKTVNAKFARGLDRLMPLMHNYYTQGKTWQKFDVKSKHVLEQNKIIQDASEELWDFAKSLINDAIKKRYLI